MKDLESWEGVVIEVGDACVLGMRAVAGVGVGNTDSGRSRKVIVKVSEEAGAIVDSMGARRDARCEG